MKFNRFAIFLSAIILLASCGQEKKAVLEIGFGNGTALAEAAARHPHNNYLGVEVHGPGVGHLMIKLAKQQSSNVRILQTDAMDLLMHRLAPVCLSGVCLFFPDPWPKKRHHKRRLFQPPFVAAAVRAETVRSRSIGSSISAISASNRSMNRPSTSSKIDISRCSLPSK